MWYLSSAPGSESPKRAWTFQTQYAAQKMLTKWISILTQPMQDASVLAWSFASSNACFSDTGKWPRTTSLTHCVQKQPCKEWVTSTVRWQCGDNELYQTLTWMKYMWISCLFSNEEASKRTRRALKSSLNLRRKFDHRHNSAINCRQATRRREHLITSIRRGTEVQVRYTYFKSDLGNFCR